MMIHLIVYQLEVNSELPIGFMYLDYFKVHDLGLESTHINYYFKMIYVNLNLEKYIRAG
ncbi:hypothetical protein [Borrelia miyamotoi]|nr:hypothetical protein F9Y91_00645 [Borrelia miyamotoi]